MQCGDFSRILNLLGQKEAKGVMSMKIDMDIESQVKEIMAAIECPKDFECYKSGFEKIGKVKNLEAENLCVCLEENAQSCKFSFSYGNVYFCKCPLRLYIAKKLKK